MVDKMPASDENEIPVISNIGPEVALKMIEDNLDNPDFVILDIRTPKEFAEGHIGGAVNLDFYSEDFQKQLNEKDKDKIYLVCCGSGVRGVKTLAVMQDLGYVEIYHILGGINMWKAMDLPLTKK